jgi:hypothetical protein
MKYTTESRSARFAVVLGIGFLLRSSFARAQQPQDQGHIGWAANDSGHPNCIERYLAFPILQTCYWVGSG